MCSFKEMMQEDITEVFLDPEMFGELHMVAGKECVIILDDLEKLRRSNQYRDTDAIHKKRILFSIAAKDLGRLPDIGETMEIDGRIYRVVHGESEDGIYVITAEANRSNGGF